MSFVTQDDVFAAVEPVLRGVFEEFAGGKPVTPKFPRIPYARRCGNTAPTSRTCAIRSMMQDVTEDFSRLRLQDLSPAILEASAAAAVWAIPAPSGGSRASAIG